MSATTLSPHPAAAPPALVVEGRGPAPAAFPLVDPRADEYAPYLSRLAARSLARRPRNEPEAVRLKGAALFADLSGFSSLAESMCRTGGPGPRRLAQVLNRCFGVLIDIVLQHGGDVTGFAGDGLTAVWTARGWRGVAVAATQAAQCGRALQAALQAHHRAVGSSSAPPLRVGVGAGTIFSVHAGGVERRWLHCALGPAVTQATHAQEAGRPGEVLLSPAAARFVGRRARLSTHRGHARVDAIRDPVLGFRSPPVCIAGFVDQVADACVPNAVRSRIRRGAPRTAEVRRLTVVFVNLPHLDHRATLGDAQRTMQAIQRAVADGRGAVDKLMVDGKGTTVLAAFGMPPASRAGDAVDAVRASFAIREALREEGWSCSIGVTTGPAFCGEVGNARRREYTILGAGVNRAARLMQRAAGGILIDGATAQAAGGRFELDRAPALELAGTGDQLPVFQALGDLQEDARRPRGLPTPLVGRRSELAALSDLVGALRRGVGRTAVLRGPAGVGKSRLLDEVEARFHEVPEVRVLRARGQRAERAVPYAPWRPVFGSLLCRSLLGSFPAAPTPRERGSAVPAEAVRGAAAELLAAAAHNHALLLLVDDAHELDAPSWELLAEVRRSDAPVAIVLATRSGAPVGPVERALHADPSVVRLRLQPLAPDQIVALACGRLRTRGLPPRARDRLVDCARGNPGAAEQLLAAWLDEGRLGRRGRRLVGGDPGAAGEDLTAVLRRRLRRLPPEDRRLLQVAAVAGLAFDPELVEALWDGPRPLPLAGRLDRLQEAGLLTNGGPAAPAFVHEALRSAAEASVEPARLRALHRAAARLAALPGSEGRRGRVFHHWRAAGEAALALPLAVRFFEQAHAAGSASGVVAFAAEAALFQATGPEDRAAAARRRRVLGEAWAALGKDEEAARCLHEASAGLGEPVGSRSRVGMRLALLGGRVSDRARGDHPDPIPPEIASLHVEAARARLALARLASEPLEALWHAEAGLRWVVGGVARSDRAELAAEAARAAADLGRADLAHRRAAEARRLVAEGADAQATLEVLLVLADVARRAGREHAAVLHLRRAIACARRLGAGDTERRARRALASRTDVAPAPSGEATRPPRVSRAG